MTQTHGNCNAPEGHSTRRISVCGCILPGWPLDHTSILAARGTRRAPPRRLPLWECALLGRSGRCGWGHEHIEMGWTAKIPSVAGGRSQPLLRVMKLTPLAP